jgi:2'-5' RNA ligase
LPEGPATRLFIALPLPERLTLALERIQEGVAGANWVPRENMHLTLRFIGETDGDTFEDLIEALAEVVVESFSLEIAGVGHF